MKRVYVLLPTEESCHAVAEELEASGIPASHLHVIASLTHDLRDLPRATIWQRTELTRGIAWGLVLGGIAGLMGGLLVVNFPIMGDIVLGSGAVFAATAAGAGFGALMGALLGSQEHNRRLDAFRRALGAGELLLMVDVARSREQEVKTAILRHHPEAEIRSVRRSAA